MNLKIFRICLVFTLIICLVFPNFALEADWTGYEWYKTEGGWRCKEDGQDLIDKKIKVGYNTYEFDKNGFAVCNGLVQCIGHDEVYYLYDKDVNPVKNEYIKVFGEEYYTNDDGCLNKGKSKNIPSVYIDLDAFDFDFEKAKLERDQVLSNEAAFHSFVNANTEKKTELVFEPYKLGEVILNADGTVTDVKTGNLIRNKAISYEWVDHNQYGGKDTIYTSRILLDESGNRVSGYYLYGNTVYRFSPSNQHEFRYIVTDAKEKANALAELDANKNGYSIVSSNTTNNKPVFSEIQMPVAQDKSVVSEIEAPVAHTD